MAVLSLEVAERAAGQYSGRHAGQGRSRGAANPGLGQATAQPELTPRLTSLVGLRLTVVDCRWIRIISEKNPMRCRLSGLWILALLGLSACQQASTQDSVGQTIQSPPMEVYFSPKGGCTEAVVRELAAARSTVLVQAYSFTSAPIAKALIEAHKRGVKVQIVLDKSQRTEKYSPADFLVNMGIPTSIDAKHAIAHNKIIIVDGQTVITGSFNFTKNAEENNAENLLVIRSPELAARYTANWEIHAAHSEPYEAREEGYSETHRAEHAHRSCPCCRPFQRATWRRRTRPCSTRRAARERRRFRRRTSSITPRGRRRSKPGRSHATSATRRRCHRGDGCLGQEPRLSRWRILPAPRFGPGTRSTP